MSIKLNKSDIPQLLLDGVHSAFPEYRGRKWQFQFATEYHLQNYWSGGTIYEAVAINLATGEVIAPVWETTNPFSSVAHQTVEIPPDVAIIEHIRFCGKDMGIRFHLHPTNATAKFLPR
jgi:hypothetical protein